MTGDVLDLFGGDEAPVKRHWGLNRDPGMKDAIRRMYVDQGMTVQAIADTLGVGATTVSRFKKEFDVQTRTRPSDVGRTYGRWTVLAESREGGRGFPTVCRCRCSCGTEADVPRGNLQQGLSQSCGCLHLDLQSRPEGESMRDSILADYRRHAKRRHLEWSLTVDQATHLLQGDCHYCGSPPSKIRNHGRCNGSYQWNGIDRKDNARGYSEDNATTACERCNMMKRCMSVQEFQAWAERIVSPKHHTLRVPVTESQARVIYGDYRATAKRKSVLFELPFQDFHRLIQEACEYCGAPPSNHRSTLGGFRYSGIDRVDNDKWYSVGNCKPACALCNSAKKTLDVDDFLSHVRRIATYRQVSTSIR